MCINSETDEPAAAIPLPAVVLVTRLSTYHADADACLAAWTRASGPSLARLDDDDARGRVHRLVSGQLKEFMPLTFGVVAIAEPTLSEVEVEVGYASVRVIVQVFPEA